MSKQNNNTFYYTLKQDHLSTSFQLKIQVNQESEWGNICSQLAKLEWGILGLSSLNERKQKLLLDFHCGYNQFTLTMKPIFHEPYEITTTTAVLEKLFPELFNIFKLYNFTINSCLLYTSPSPRD